MENSEMQKEKFLLLINQVERDDLDLLIDNLESMGFFNAPCSAQHHLCEYGGLVEHSNNVCLLALKVAESVGYQNRDSIIIASLLHDVGKCGDYGKQNCVENLIKGKGKDKDELLQSAVKPFVTNKELLYIPHEVRSIAIIRQWFNLTEEEEHAIYYHNGKYTHSGYDLKETPLQMILRFSDLFCSREIEKDEVYNE